MQVSYVNPTLGPDQQHQLAVQIRRTAPETEAVVEPNSSSNADKPAKKPASVCGQWILAGMVLWTQIMLPIIDTSTDFYSASSFQSEQGCVRNILGDETNDATTQRKGYLFLSAISGTLWFSALVGLISCIFHLTRLLRALRTPDKTGRYITWAEYEEDVTGRILTHGCNTYKITKFITVVLEDIPQIVCNMLIATYISGFASYTSTKVTISIVLIGRAFARISTFVWPWGWLKSKNWHGRSITMCKCSVFAVFFILTIVAVLSPVWIRVAQFQQYAHIAHEAMFDVSTSPEPRSDTMDAYLGLSEARVFQYEWKAVACATTAGAVTYCTPGWDTQFLASVTTGKLPWDVMSYQVLRKQATQWTVYSAGSDTAPAASDTVVLALREREQELQYTLIEASGSEGLSFLPKPVYVATDKDVHADLMVPKTTQKRITVTTPACPNAPCWINYTFTANDLAKVNVQMSALSLHLYISKSGECAA
jgi:hypothetical protein